MIESTKLTKAALEDAIPEGENGPSQAPPHRAVRFWQAVIVGILFVFIVFLALRLLQANRSELRASGSAPPFTFTTFEGETISLDDLKGKGVVLNFWASWCDPCRDEAALLEATWRAEQDNGIVFLGLDYLDQEPAALAYLKEYDITYPNGPDLRSEAARRYGIKGVPETFFIDSSGNIVEIIIGPIVDSTRMSQLLDKIRPQTTTQ
jgi:cytochrome c biogenesis protein CcmG/thiol:disulfide interchange protein DsbE